MSRIIIAAGGTGGHLYPAISLGHDLQQQDVEVLFLGQNLPSPGFSISGSALSRNPKLALKSVFLNMRGVWQSFRIMRKFRPDLIVGFGSIYSLPTLIAGLFLKVPILLHEQNCVPGRANRWMSRYAKLTAVTFPEASKQLRSRTELVEMPLRAGYRVNTLTKEESRKLYGLDPSLTTLLVFGGSQGATAINQLITAALPKLREKMDFQVLHLVGKYDSADEIRSLYRRLGIKAHVKAFEEKMDRAWQAADLVISRAGAGTVAEQIAFEVPGILIPYPYAKDRHQDKNADFMQQVVKGGIKSIQADLDPDLLSLQIERLLDPEKLDAMRKAIQEYKKKNPRSTMVEVIRKVIHD